MRRELFASFFLAITICFGSSACGGPTEEDVSTEISARIESGDLPVPASGVEVETYAEALADFYRRRSFAPAWVDGDGPTAYVDSALSAFCRADAEGLWPASYATPTLLESIDALRDAPASSDTALAAQLADVDLLLTLSYMRYASDLLTGRVDPHEIGSGWKAPVHQIELAEVLTDSATSGVRFGLHARLSQRHEAYGQLRDALQRYRQVAARGGWPAVPSGDALEPGASGERVRLLRARLAATGDLNASGADAGETFDAATAAAVARFQWRHGLEPDSVAGDDVIREMNVPVEKRIRQIELNLERWRWIAANLGSRYVYVNVPAFELHAFEAGSEALAMRVVVGKEYDDQATPVFSDTMQYVVFRPYWNVPESIAKEEIVPAARSDPGYLTRNNFEIVRNWDSDDAIASPRSADLDRVENGTYRIRQKPGASNSLGLIKFMFPNEFNIYLHDTPAAHLFERADRAYSHGCIRVEDPVALAQFVFAGSMSKNEIEERLEDGDNQTVPLEHPIPVYILYWTTFVNEGAIHFRKDLYGQDAHLDEALARIRPANDTPDECRQFVDERGGR